MPPTVHRSGDTVAMPTRSLPSFRPADLSRELLIGAVSISPDGANVAYTRREVRDGKDLTSIWVVPFAGGRPRRLTHHPGSDSQPTFSPDGRTLAFLSDRHESTNQLHVLPLDGGEALRLTEFKHGVAEVAWLPDGRRLAVLAHDDTSPIRAGERDKGEPTARRAAPRRLAPRHRGPAGASGARPPGAGRRWSHEAADARRVVCLVPEGHSRRLRGRVPCRPRTGGRPRARSTGAHRPRWRRPGPPPHEQAGADSALRIRSRRHDRLHREHQRARAQRRPDAGLAHPQARRARGAVRAGTVDGRGRGRSACA